MRKSALLLPLILVFTLLLSACAGGGENNANSTPGSIETQPIPDTGATEGLDMNTPTVDSTPALDVTEATGTATQDATEEVTEEVTEETTPTTGAAGGNKMTTPTADSAVQPGDGQGAGVIGIPQTGSGGFVGLAAMMDWQVVSADGSPIGTVQDYVVNTCEAHILYLVVDPAEGMIAEGGQQILIPYETVLGELNEGSEVDVEQQTYTLKQNAAALMGVPGVDIATANLENPLWSEEVLDYWEANDYRLSLTAGCPVPVSGGQGTDGADQQATPAATPAATQDASQPGFDVTPTVDSTLTLTPGAGDNDNNSGADRQTIYRLALASKLINAQLQEGNGRLLGSVQDIAIVPETGRTQFFVVETSDLDQGSDRMVALPPGVVNISYETNANQPTVVLLVETSVLQGAPDFDGASSTGDDWFNFWSQQIPMTREALP